MHVSICRALGLSLFCVSLVSAAERSATPAASIHVMDGFQVELLCSAQADEGSWISMTFDSQGDVILGEDRAGLLRLTLGETPESTRVEKLSGTESLKHCRGVLYAHGSLYVCATDGEGLYRLRDQNGDGTYEDRQLLIPLEYRSRYGHGANQISQGPDGLLYLVVGNDVAFPAAAENSRYGRPRNDWLLPSRHDVGQDDRVGYVLRMDADGKGQTIICGGLRNAMDIAFNADGEGFTWDADMEWDAGLPWYRPTRFNHVISGGEYGWRWGTGKWPAWFPDSLPSTLDTGLGSPTGVVFGTASTWPDRFRHALYGADWQNGRILMVEFTPQGSSYQGHPVAFLEGSPLNVCDLQFGPDGALYFITGGRGSQSGLYRVTCTQPAAALTTAGPVPDASADDEARQARLIRRQLEALHGHQDSSQLDFVWDHLPHEDPWVRFSARVALESLPLDAWRKRVAQAADSRARHAALLALARVGADVDQKIVLKGLKEWDWNQESTAELLWGLRTLQLSLIRQGPVDDVARQSLLRKLHSLPAQESFAVNWLLAENLVALKSPEAIERTLVLLERGATQEEQIQFAKTLTQVSQGWTLPQRQRMLDWLAAHRKLPGGKLVKQALLALKTDTLESLSGEERIQLTEQLARLEEPVAEEQEALLPVRPLVKKWTMSDLEADVSALRPQDRSIERGRAALAAAICLRCHQFGDRGGQVGPNLSAVGKRFDGRALLESIIEPSRVIDPKYHNSLYQLEDGRVVSGRTISVSKEQIGVETDPLTGANITIAREEILESRSSDVSPMPQGLLDTLTRDEILDLIAYLRSPGR